MKITQIGHLHFTVTSASRPGVLHLVDLQRQADAGPDSRRAFCSCEAYNFNPGGYCKHIVAVVQKITPSIGGKYATAAKPRPPRSKKKR